MNKRYSIEYCGKRYLLVERTENKIIYENNSIKAIREYAKNNNIKFINE